MKQGYLETVKYWIQDNKIVKKMSHMAVLQNATVKLFGDWKKHIWDENFIHGSGQNEETEQAK